MRTNFDSQKLNNWLMSTAMLKIIICQLKPSQLNFLLNVYP